MKRDLDLAQLRRVHLLTEQLSLELQALKETARGEAQMDCEDLEALLEKARGMKDALARKYGDHALREGLG
jgi:hypothetical protein